MTSNRARVVFMGSPDIAVPALEAVSDRHDVALVVTQPDRPSGRGRKLRGTAVRERAESLSLPVLATEDVNCAESVEIMQAARPDAMIVVSFGQMLKRRVLQLPAHGCLNVHFSLLPDLRGAAPVAWALIRGLGETGVSIMKMVLAMDAGPVFAQAVEPIADDDTTASLSARLAVKGAELLSATLGSILTGELEGIPQDGALATFAPKIDRSIGRVDWTRPAREVDNLIRGLEGRLAAYGFIMLARETRVAFHRSAVAEGNSPGPGVVARGAAGELLVGCRDGLVEILEIQAQGRKRMPGAQFANGSHLEGGERFVDVQ